MGYKVILDGQDIFDLDRKDKALINAKIEDKLNESSSFQFTIPPMHEFLQNKNQVHLLKSSVTVYRENQPNIILFYGRPSEITIDFYKNQQIYCEGMLSFFNDTLLPAQEFESTTMRDFLQWVIDQHNSQVNPDRQFQIGRFEWKENKSIYRKTNREKTLDALKSMLLNAEGGYMFTRHVDGVNYIDYLEELTDVSGQDVELGVNLQDLSIKQNASNLFTKLVSYDSSKESSADGNGNPKQTSDTVVANDNLVNDFGPVYKTYDTKSKTETPAEYLDRHKNDYLSVEATALDMSEYELIYEPYEVGQLVWIKSLPHDMYNKYPILSATTDLNKQQRIIKTGTETNKDLTEITKNGSGGGTRYHPPVHLPSYLYYGKGATGETTIRCRYDNGDDRDVQSFIRNGTLYYDPTTGYVLTGPNPISRSLHIN